MPLCIQEGKQQPLKRCRLLLWDSHSWSFLLITRRSVDSIGERNREVFTLDASASDIPPPMSTMTPHCARALAWFHVRIGGLLESNLGFLGMMNRNNVTATAGTEDLIILQ